MADAVDMLNIEDGKIIRSEWSDDLCRELLRALRKTRAAAPDAPEAEEYPGDVAVTARIFHEVLSLSPAGSHWPVFSSGRLRHSLVKAAILHAVDDPDLTSLLRLSNESALLAANVARWMLQMKQQTVTTSVFASPPPARTSIPKPRKTQSSLLTAC